MSDENHRQSMGDPAFQRAVEETAYFLWEHDGRPQGRENDYWFRALEQTLRERNADRDLKRAPDMQPAGQVDGGCDDLGRSLTDGTIGEERFLAHN